MNNDDSVPALSRSQALRVLRLAREQAGIRPRKTTLREARAQGFAAGARAAIEILEKMTKETANE